jgi:hypothetical protein
MSEAGDGLSLTDADRAQKSQPPPLDQAPTLSEVLRRSLKSAVGVPTRSFQDFQHTV